MMRRQREVKGQRSDINLLSRLDLPREESCPCLCTTTRNYGRIVFFLARYRKSDTSACYLPCLLKIFHALSTKDWQSSFLFSSLLRTIFMSTRLRRFSMVLPKTELNYDGAVYFNRFGDWMTEKSSQLQSSYVASRSRPSLVVLLRKSTQFGRTTLSKMC